MTMLGKKHSIESRKRMSEKAKGRIVSEETRKKIGEITRQRLAIHHHLRGIKQTEEVKLRKSIALKKWFDENPHPMDGKHYNKKRKGLSDEHKKEIGNRRKGSKHSDFTRLMMSKAHIGKNTWSRGRPAWNKGVPHSEEHKQKLKEKRRHRVIPSKDTIPERMMQIALALNGVKFKTHKPIIGQPDIFIEPNICVFIDGDYPHANPIKYDANDLIWGKKASDRWAYDIKINNELSKLGYFIIRLWETDIKKNTQGCAENVIKMIKERMEVF